VENVRQYGSPPFNVAVIHGGPGAAGEMAPVARELASERGVLEPIQTATSLVGQVEELKAVLEAQGDPPLILIGFSWGAWLSFIVAARHPDLVEKLVLVGCGPFQEAYVATLHETRMERFGEEDRWAFDATVEALNDPDSEDKDRLLAQLGALTRKSDAYDPIPNLDERSDEVGPAGHVFQKVWQEAAELRRNEGLLQLARGVECPVVAVHGDYDPHPSEGVRIPLTSTLHDFRFVLLENCGHKPWIERQARDAFYRVLRRALS
jgi:pimeloyl-ACP methyl ester carboxylesterase